MHDKRSQRNSKICCKPIGLLLSGALFSAFKCVYLYKGICVYILSVCACVLIYQYIHINACFCVHVLTCTYIQIYIYEYVCMRACVCVCYTSKYSCLRVYTNVSIYVYIYICIRVGVCMCLCVYARVCTYLFVCI